MRKLNHKLMMEMLLRRSPHRVQNALLQTELFHATKREKFNAGLEELRDEAYINVFSYVTFCEYLLDPQYRIHNSRAQMRARDSGPIHNAFETTRKVQVDNLKSKKRQTEARIMGLITKLNENRYSYSVYTEAEETVLVLTPAEAQEHKKFLVYMYTWVLKQKDWKSEEFEKIAESLGRVVIKKIYEGFENTPDKDKVKQQLEGICKTMSKRKQAQAQKQKQKVEKILSSYESRDEIKEDRKKE